MYFSRSVQSVFVSCHRFEAALMPYKNHYFIVLKYCYACNPGYFIRTDIFEPFEKQ